MALSDVYPAYRGLCDLVCGTQAEVVEKSDVIFAALPHGLSQDLAAECDAQGKAFIDLGADFRLESEEEYKEWYGGTFADKALHEKAVYGLPELFREQIKKTKLVANPAATRRRCRWRSFRRSSGDTSSRPASLRTARAA